MKIDYKKTLKGFANQPDLFSFSFFKSPVIRAEPFGNTVTENYLCEPTALLIAAPAENTLPDDGPLKVAYIRPDFEIQWHVAVGKRIFDILFSLAVVIIGFPVMALLYVITKFSSKGPAIYRQERIGKNRRPFYIYKFRSMRIDAEAAGPQLSSEHDPRITKWGRVIRRTRLDELPQFWNVLKGDMSVVGPRPERQHFIDKIVEKNSDYQRLHRLKPGITSMGQVQFGYAENVEQMCTRMLHDLYYLDNLSLLADLKVILKTVRVMFECKGK